MFEDVYRGVTVTLSLNRMLSILHAKTSFQFEEFLYLSAPKTTVSQATIT